MSDWYAVPVKEVLRLGAWRFLKHYGSSLPEALKVIYPQYSWDPSLFSEAAVHRAGRWSNPNHQREFLESVGKELGVTDVRSAPQNLHSLTSWTSYLIGIGYQKRKYWIEEAATCFVITRPSQAHLRLCIPISLGRFPNSLTDHVRLPAIGYIKPM